MANELTVAGSIKFSSGLKSFEKNLKAFIESITTKKWNNWAGNIGTTEEAMVLGEVTSLGWLLILNYDVTNFVEVRTATAGTKFCQVPAATKDAPGFALFKFGAGVTAPFLIADTAAVDVEYWIVSR